MCLCFSRFLIIYEDIRYETILMLIINMRVLNGLDHYFGVYKNAEK